MATDARPSSEDPTGEASRLDGWKEIATYLNRHVTTVRRWEKTEGLPVHRHVHEKLGSVYAFRGELDAWWRGRRAHLEAARNDDLAPEDEGEAQLIESQTPALPVAPAIPVECGVSPSGPAADVPPEDSRGFISALNAAAEAHGFQVAFTPFRRRVLAGALTIAVALLVSVITRPDEPSRREIGSVAVLPLQNLSNDPTQEYFADGMTDSLVVNLSQIEALRVISRTSVMRFKGSSKPLRHIAGELNVDAVIEGSVQRAGTRVKIAMQLVDGASGHNIWAREYERNLSDVLKLQAEVARAVADEIRIHVTAEARARLGSAHRIDPAAHEAYLLGRYHAWKLNDDDLKLAVGHFERAIQIDPKFAAAYADLSLAWQYRSVFATAAFDETEGPAKRAAQTALALDDRLAAAHMAIGHFKYAYELDFAGAETDLRRAVDLNPSSVDAHYYYAKLLQSLGRFPEAIQHLERARELDPLSSSVASFLGRTLYRAGRYEDALVHLNRAIQLEPRNTTAYSRLTDTYAEMGRYDEALTSHQREYERTGARVHLVGVARLQALTGKPMDARQTLDRLMTSDESGVAVAMIHAALGDNDEAFRLLMKAVEEGDHARLLFIKVDPPFAPLRSDPRWTDLLGLMNLPS